MQDTSDWMGNKMSWRARLRRRFRRRAAAGDGAGVAHGQPGHGQGHHGPGAGRPRADGAGPHFHGMSLDDQKPGTSVRIRGLHGRGPIRQRLLDMGLVPGAEIAVIRSAPLRDPIEVRIGDTFLTLRRAEAARIEVVHV
ncbi:FeoA family protein [Roseospirillum parvum]|uniref:Ferrous iron transport protein A n=1 Tax=Roseospirillum parvum TaxID=83401 RepID=A0A1G8ELC7_9PROT|nr:FeoA family protein [Roseospirillum parvum]SDH70661.1 ferrous iron transport protein A [Roseospirillum parvum]